MATLDRIAVNGASGIAQVARHVRSGELRAEDHVRAVIEDIRIRNARINAFVDLTEERALARAKTIDAAIASRADPGPLAGVTFAAKNLFDVSGLPTLAGSRINRERPPATT